MLIDLMLEDIKAICWDLEGLTYNSPPLMIDEIKLIYCQKLANQRGISIEEAIVIFEKQYESSNLNQSGVVDHRILPINEASELVDSACLENKYIFSDPTLQDLFKCLSGYTHYAMTNQSLKSSELVIQRIGIPIETFDKIYTSDDVTLPKPDLESFELLLDYSPHEPHEILFIGDLEKVDIIPASSVGMRTCIVGADSDHADFVLENVYQLSMYL